MASRHRSRVRITLAAVCRRLERVEEISEEHLDDQLASIIAILAPVFEQSPHGLNQSAWETLKQSLLKASLLGTETAHAS